MKRLDDAEISRTELDFYREKYHADYCTGNFTPTLCALNGVRKPLQAGCDPAEKVLSLAAEKLKGGKIEKMLIFCPDAIGEVHRDHCPEIFDPLDACADLRLRGTTAMLSVTPICFATIFSGASPIVHGIRNFEYTVLRVETLFDVLAEAGRNVALVVRDEQSLDHLFRKRKLDYYGFRTDEEVERTTIRLVKEGYYDVIVSYMSDFDHYGHHTDVFSPECIRELNTAVRRFRDYAELIDKYWAKYNRLLTFTPDHGQHRVCDAKGYHGTHRDDVPEDMVINHFFRIRPKDE